MTKVFQVRVDEKLKKQADKVFFDIGLDASTAVRIFLKKVVITRSIPFGLDTGLTENGFTPEEEAEILETAADPEYYGPFESADAAIDFLHDKSK